MILRSILHQVFPHGLVLSLCLLSSLAFSQDTRSGFQLPENPQFWINSQPWSLDQLAGKAVFLYFFEETCPTCMQKWDDMNQLASSHAEDPILFIAVSSGTDRVQMQDYVERNNVQWPVLLDPDRTLETACDAGEVSLENIMQVAIIGPDGAVSRGNWREMEQSVAQALNGASWTVDPKTIPDNLKATWRQMEFHDYAAAAASIRRSLKSNKAETKTAAEALLAAIQPKIDAKVAAAEAAYDAGEKWPALQAYTELTNQFRGYELPENVDARKKELQADPSIKVEAGAMKVYQAAMRQLANPAQRKKGILSLKKLVKDKPDTEAGRKAQSELATLGES